MVSETLLNTTEVIVYYSSSTLGSNALAANLYYCRDDESVVYTSQCIY